MPVKEEFRLRGQTLYAGKLYRVGDEGKLSDEAREAIAAKYAGTGRRMPPREVSSGVEYSQNPADVPGMQEVRDSMKATAEAAAEPKKSRGRKKAEE